MRRLVTVVLVVALLVLAFPGAVSAVPGTGRNALLVSLECEDGSSLTLVSQANLSGVFATAHIVGSNRPVPLVSLSYVLSVGGVVIDRGSFAHAHPQQGQPLVDCTGSFEVTDPTTGDILHFDIESTGFFPAGK